MCISVCVSHGNPMNYSIPNIVLFSLAQVLQTELIHRVFSTHGPNIVVLEKAKTFTQAFMVYIPANKPASQPSYSGDALEHQSMLMCGVWESSNLEYPNH